MIVWRTRGGLLFRYVQCCAVYHSCAPWYAHTHIRLGSSRRWLFVLVFVRFCILLTRISLPVGLSILCMFSLGR